MKIHPQFEYMKIKNNLNNKGNAKILTILLSLTGAGIIYVNQTSNVNPQAEVLSKFSNIQKQFEDTKIKYIDQPLTIVANTKKELNDIQSNKDVISKEINVLGETSPSKTITFPTTSLPVSSTLPTNLPKSENLNQLTSQMVENCKVITEEYNKLQKSK